MRTWPTLTVVKRRADAAAGGRRVGLLTLRFADSLRSPVAYLQ